MKKLLALVLCVMMFVSVLSTAAFADKPTTPPTPTWTAGGWNTTTINNKAIKNAKENIEFMYGTLAADNAVFGTIKSVDEVVSNLVKGMFEDVDSINANVIGLGNYEVGHDKLVDNSKSFIRDVVGTEIIKYMNKHMGDFAKASTKYYDTGDVNGTALRFTGLRDQWGALIYESDTAGIYYGYDAANDAWYFCGAASAADAAANRTTTAWAATTNVKPTTTYKYDPIAYANAFATAATKAMTDEKSTAALQRIAYELAQLKVYDDVSDDLDDLKDLIDAWQGTDGILAQYNFGNPVAGDWDPYAMLNENYYPNAFALDYQILAP